MPDMPVVFSLSGFFSLIGLFMSVSVLQFVILAVTPKWKRWPVGVQIAVSLMATMVLWTAAYVAFSPE